MKRTEWLQETRKMRFEEGYGGWQQGRLTQEEAARLLGVCERTFRRHIDRYEDEGLEGLIDKRLSQVSHRRAPVDEVVRLVDGYRKRHEGWNAKHFYAWYKRDGGERSYSWVKNRLQDAHLVPKAAKRGAHRKKRERSPLPGMMLHQDASTHEWVPGQHWDLVVTMDDATNGHYSMFFVEEEGTQSSFRGVRDVIEAHGLFSAFYSDRGSHYWTTQEAGGKVDKVNLTQFGRAMKHLGVHMIAAYSPEARGRSERVFGTLQGRLPKELALEGIVDVARANGYLKRRFIKAYNREFAVQATESGNAFIAYIGASLGDILCVQEERVVRADNCVAYQNKILQIPADAHRCHYVKARVRVHEYPSGELAIFHGPRCLARYDLKGKIQQGKSKLAA